MYCFHNTFFANFAVLLTCVFYQYILKLVNPLDKIAELCMVDDIRSVLSLQNNELLFRKALSLKTLKECFVELFSSICVVCASLEFA